jgi:uncharacterized NAD(P)/FAD-binding protein YdhS
MPDEKSRPDRCVAIVGGGFSGTMVAVHLLKTAAAPLTVVLIERASQMGRGAAYGTSELSHLLNVPAAKMSAYPDEPDHFLNWVRAEGSRFGWPESSAVEAGTFVPRLLYGAYLGEQLRQAAQSAADGVRLEKISDEAAGLKMVDGRARIALKSGRVLSADRVVLAWGNFPPPVPGAAADHFGRSARYIGNPWLPGALSRVGEDNPVLIVGSGLTMADAVLSLRNAGHRGTIHVVSRHGLLPQPHRAAEPYPAFIDAQKIPSAARKILRLLRKEVGKAGRGGHDWRAVLDSMRPLIPKIWRSLGVKEQARFIRHARPYWDVHRHRLPPQVFKILDDLREEGRLKVQAARIEGFKEKDGAVEVSLRPRHSDKREILTAGFVINCTGPECDLSRLKDPLIASLLAQGLIRPDPLRLGMDVNTLGALLDRGGHPSAVLFTLGASMKGLLWESIAVPELRVQAQALCRNLI